MVCYDWFENSVNKRGVVYVYRGAATGDHSQAKSECVISVFWKRRWSTRTLFKTTSCRHVESAYSSHRSEQRTTTPHSENDRLFALRL